MSAQPKPYSQAEVEALAALEAPTLIDDWHCWNWDPSDDLLRQRDPELASKIDRLASDGRRHRRACRKLYVRGLVERRKFNGGLFSCGFYYRLIPMLRPTRRTPAEVEADS